MKRKTLIAGGVVALIGLAGLAGVVTAQGGRDGWSGQHRGPGAMMGHGMMPGGMMGMMRRHHSGMMKGGMMGRGMGMRMLNGRDTTRAEVEEMRTMFMRHPDITRSVTNLPDGIETLTESTDPDLAAAIVGHVAKMTDRMEKGRDPMVPIQSPTLQILFERGESITTEMTPTDNGIRVKQTSTDPEVVAALQKHAAEVSDLAARGMAAVRDSMMQRHMGGRGMGMMRGMFSHN